MLKKFKSRRGKLELGLKGELPIEYPNIENILSLVDSYEKDNLDTIDKLKRDKSLELKRINGALKQTIDAHGPITKVLIGSSSKRIYGALLASQPKPSNNMPKYSIKSILLGFTLASALFLSICLFL